MESNQPLILLIEDDDGVAEMVADHLQSTVNARVIRTRGASETLDMDLEGPVDVVLADICLPDGNGLDLVRVIQAAQDVAVVMMTGRATLARAVESLRLGVADLLIKPFELGRLTSVIQRLLAERRAQVRREQRMQRLRRVVRKALEDRRELQQRVDLVCRDLVGSYRELAERFVRQAAPDCSDVD